MGNACSSSFQVPGIPGQALLDDLEFIDCVLDLESSVKVFNSTALYTRGEQRKDTYNMDTNKWKTVKYFEREAISSAGLIFKMNNGSWLVLELSEKGFWWCFRTKEDSKRIAQLERIHVSETFRHPVPIEFVRRLLSEQKDRCYERGSLFSFSEFACTVFKQILKRQIEIEAAAQKELERLRPDKKGKPAATPNKKRASFPFR